MAEKTKGKTQKMAGWKKALIVVGALFLLVILFLGYLGFVPIVSDLLGATTPKDLGVRHTHEDMLSGREKLGVNLKSLPASTDPAHSVQYEGEKPIDKSFTNEELSALMSNQKWKYALNEKTQMKVHDDGTVEMSGVFRRNRFSGYMDATGVTEEERTGLNKVLSWVTTNPRFYVIGNAGIKNNKVNLDLDAVQIGRVNMPIDIAPRDTMENFIERRLERMDGLDIESLTFENGETQLKGTVPAVEKSVWQE